MDLQDLTKEDLENKENNIKKTHNIYDQKLKDQQKYYEQGSTRYH